jgi:N-acetylmuramoyl-L-alanine amidase
MPPLYSVQQAMELALLVLLIGREGRGETYEAMLAIGWSVRNRVTQPRYWGHDWITVISHPEAYSSMVPPMSDNDPNLRVYPDLKSSKWALVVEAAEAAYTGVGPDPTNGATHYYDRSLDDRPPAFATDPHSVHTCDIGDLHFFKAN